MAVSAAAWAGLAGLLIVACLARASFGSWRHPAAFFAALWVCASVPAYLSGTGRISGLAMLLVAALVGAFLVGSVGTARALESGRRDLDQRAWAIDSPSLLRWVVLLGLTGVAAVISYVASSPAGLSALGSLEGWVDMAVGYSVTRYQGEETESLFVRLLVALNYSGAILAGALSALEVPRRRFLVYLPILACGLITLVTTAKTPLLLGVLCMGSGRFAMQMSACSEEPVRRGRGRVRNVALILLGSLVLLASLVFRYGGASEVDLELIMERVSGYLFGQVYVFSAWISTGGLNVVDPGFGRNTLAGVFELLGIGHREAGFYSYIVLDDATSDSNIFTAFRGLIQDFLLPGALAFMLILGAVAECCVKAAGSALSLVSGITVLAAVYLFLGWSPIISIFIYNDMLFAMGVVFLVLLSCIRGAVQINITVLPPKVGAEPAR
jgi:oligosaccharide repeat unit polymerase